MIETTKYSRKSFDVDAVLVTEENINEVAEWCGGEVRYTKPRPDRESNPYVKVRVFRPMGERQTRAYVGDWVLYAGTGYKVYPDKAFQTCFTEAN